MYERVDMELKEDKCPIAQSAGFVEYTDCASAEGVRLPPNECPVYDT